MIATDFANLGEAQHLSGVLDEAERLYREALTLFEALGDPRGQGFVLGQIGLLALDRGNATEARELLCESLRLLWYAGLRGSAADMLQALAEATWRLGELDVAATLLQTADGLREETGLVRQPVYEVRYQRVLAAVGDHITYGVPRYRSDGGHGNPQADIAVRAPRRSRPTAPARTLTQGFAADSGSQPRDSAKSAALATAVAAGDAFVAERGVFVLRDGAAAGSTWVVALFWQQMALPVSGSWQTIRLCSAGCGRARSLCTHPQSTSRDSTRCPTRCPPRTVRACPWYREWSERRPDASGWPRGAPRRAEHAGGAPGSGGPEEAGHSVKSLVVHRVDPPQRMRQGMSISRHGELCLFPRDGKRQSSP